VASRAFPENLKRTPPGPPHWLAQSDQPDSPSSCRYGRKAEVKASKCFRLAE
jgi:hypothetical protein